MIFDSERTHALLRVLRDDAAEELGTAAGPVRKTTNSLRRVEITVVDRAEQRQRGGRPHDVPHALTIGDARHHATLKIRFNLFRIRLDHFAHHVAMRSLDHASERSVHGQIAEGSGEVRTLHTLLVLQKSVLAAIQVGKQRQIGIARLTVGNGPASIHYLITVIAVGSDIDLEYVRRLADDHRHRSGSATWLEKRPVLRQRISALHRHEAGNVGCDHQYLGPG